MVAETRKFIHNIVISQVIKMVNQPTNKSKTKENNKELYY